MVPPFRGNAQGNAQGNQNLTRTQGGCHKNSRGGVPSPPPLGRSLPSVGIPAGRLPGPRAGRTTSRDERRDA